MPRVSNLIIGAGLIGSSTAAQLTRLGEDSVTVLDLDLEGVFSSSELNAGAVRATFNCIPNIQASRYSIEYFRSIQAEVGFRAAGYLWLYSPEKWKGAQMATQIQRSQGWPVEEWSPSRLTQKIPFIDKLEGIQGCFFSPQDGLINPNLLKLHFRKQALQGGAVFEDRSFVRAIEIHAQAEFPIRVTVAKFNRPLGPEEKHQLATLRGTLELLSGAETVVWECEKLVNCAGAWAPLIAKMLGTPAVSQPVRRQVCVFDCREVDLSPYGMIVDTSGVYFHPEATNGIAGFATPQEPPGYHFEYDGESFFQEQIWAPLAERSTAFERLRHLTGWSGLYEVSPDESAIIGAVPGLKNRVFEAHSFSGHGVMHSHAAGVGLAELMVYGNYRSIDLTPFSGDRFNSGALLRESAVI